MIDEDVILDHVVQYNIVNVTIVNDQEQDQDQHHQGKSEQV